MSTEISLIKIFLNTAKEFSKLSHCVYVKTGAILVKNRCIIANGINGTPVNITNCDEIFDENGYDYEKHDIYSTKWELSAEMNCLMQCSKNGLSTLGADFYCTHIPHNDILKYIASSGIKKIYYIDNSIMSGEETKEIYASCSRLNIEIEQIIME